MRRPKILEFPTVSVGLKIHRWTVVAEATRNKAGNKRWFCDCKCGKSNGRIVIETALKYGQSRSCGCLGIEERTSHGHAKNKRRSRMLTIWTRMIDRCTLPRDPAYPRYGGRGIGVCKRWIDSFEAFLEDMGDPNDSKLSLDRIDNNAGYSKENCRWATQKQQSRNTRRNRLLNINGEVRCLSDWAEKVCLTPGTISARLNRGWSTGDAVNTPLLPRGIKTSRAKSKENS
jgi:hypothetical protein